MKLPLHRKLNVVLIDFLLPLALLGVAIQANAATVTANSCSKNDVQTAVTSAGRGGTVTVPAGSCTWSSTLNLSYGITLTGAGVDTTTVNSSRRRHFQSLLFRMPLRSLIARISRLRGLPSTVPAAHRL